jgi:hypothetical protein
MANELVKQKFVVELLASAANLGAIRDRLLTHKSVYFDRGYDPVGGDPIIDDDIAGLNVTATEVENMITLIEQLENFFGNSSVTTGDYDASLNQFRRDQ